MVCLVGCPTKIIAPLPSFATSLQTSSAVLGDSEKECLCSVGVVVGWAHMMMCHNVCATVKTTSLGHGHVGILTSPKDGRRTRAIASLGPNLGYTEHNMCSAPSTMKLIMETPEVSRSLDHGT